MEDSPRPKHASLGETSWNGTNLFYAVVVQTGKLNSSLPARETVVLREEIEYVSRARRGRIRHHEPDGAAWIGVGRKGSARRKPREFRCTTRRLTYSTFYFCGSIVIP